MDRSLFLERLSPATFIYVNFEKAIQERFHLLPYQNRNCHIHYTKTDECDLRLAGDLANPQQENFLTISYQKRNRDFLVHTEVNPDTIKNLAKQHRIKVLVTITSLELTKQTRISVEKNNSKKVVAFFLDLSELAFKCLI
jgi:hypothetical protein